MEFGDVQRGILGITGGTLNSERAKYFGTTETEGVYVNGIEVGSGADKGGIEKGDIIKELDGYKISKFSDLAGYLGSKRPNDVVDVTVLRNGRERVIPVTLVKLEVVELEELGLEVKNANKDALRRLGLSGGVQVSRALSRDMQKYDLSGIVITKINDEEVNNIDDVERVMNRRSYGDDIKMTFYDRDGELNTYIFR